MIGKRF